MFSFSFLSLQNKQTNRQVSSADDRYSAHVHDMFDVQYREVLAGEISFRLPSSEVPWCASKVDISLMVSSFHQPLNPRTALVQSTENCHLFFWCNFGLKAIFYRVNCVLFHESCDLFTVCFQ